MNFQTLKKAIGDWLSLNLGEAHILRLSFSSDFVSGNSISGSVNIVSFSTISFTTDHATTMTLLKQSIQNLESVLMVKSVDSRTIDVYGKNPGVTLTALISITGGVSQATITQTTQLSPEAVTIIYENSQVLSEKAPQQPYPYCTFGFGPITPVGTGRLDSFDEETNLALQEQNLVVTIFINYFGDYAPFKILKAFRSLITQETSDLFYQNKLSIQTKQSIRDLTGLLETQFEPRARFEFQVGFMEAWTEDIGTIERATFHETIENVAGEEFNLDIEITTGA